MDAASVSVFQELFIIRSILTEVPAEIHSLAVLLQIDLVSADAVCAVVDGERYHFIPPILSIQQLVTLLLVQGNIV